MNEAEAILKAFNDEVENAERLFHSWYILDELQHSSEEAFSALQRHWDFWSSTKFSYIVAFVVEFGRIFDDNSKTLSLKTLMQRCRKEFRTEFTKDAARARLVARNGEQEWTDKCLEGFSILTEQDFDALDVRYKDLNKRYAPYDKIRNEVIAHLNYKRITREGKDELFAQTNIDEVFTMLQEVKWIQLYLRSHYEIGRKLPDWAGPHKQDLGHLRHDIRQMVYEMKDPEKERLGRPTRKPM